MENDKKPIPTISVESRLGYDRLNKATVGEIVSYPELAGLMGRDPQGPGRSMVLAAINRLLRHESKVFVAVHNQGYKRANDQEAIDAGQDSLQRSRRQIKRGARKLTCVQDFDALPNHDKIRHNTTLSVLGALTLLTDGKQMKKVEAAVTKNADVLPSRKVIAELGHL